MWATDLTARGVIRVNIVADVRSWTEHQMLSRCRQKWPVPLFIVTNDRNVKLRNW